MARGTKQKLKLLYLLRIMMEQTDETHGLTIDEALSELSKYGVTAQRKSIYKDFEALTEYGFQIRKLRKLHAVSYYLSSRRFDTKEMQYLVEAIRACRFLSEDNARRMIEKFEGEVGAYAMDLIERQVKVVNRVKEGGERGLAAAKLDPVEPWRILAITFTNKAAGEIKERLKTKLGETAAEVWAGTFHSVCVRLLRQFAEFTPFGRDFLIYDQDDGKKVLAALLKEKEIRKGSVAFIGNDFSMAKDSVLYRALISAEVPVYELTECKTYEEYQEMARAEYGKSVVQFFT